MAAFDLSKPWQILVRQLPAARTGAEELARCLGLLRGPGGEKPPLGDAGAAAPGDEVPVILLNAGDGEREQGGYAWRTGRDRVEIYGDSDRGLCNGVFSFLAALGIRWPSPDREEIPPPGADGSRELAATRAAVHSRPGPAERRRLALAGGLKNGEALARWAARNGIDALVLSFRERASPPARLLGIYRRRRNRLLAAAASYGLLIEAGGRDLSSLIPRRCFFSRRELFRMEGGIRRRDGHFCPTNPESIRLLKREAERLFRSRPGTRVFHLWPGRGEEGAWCSCPSCRAFSPAEQNRIAVNAAAAVLAALDPAALLSFYEKPGEDCNIPLRPNLFALETLPEEY